MYSTSNVLFIGLNTCAGGTWIILHWFRLCLVLVFNEFTQLYTLTHTEMTLNVR